MTEGAERVLLALALGLGLLAGMLWLNARLTGWIRLAGRYGWDGVVEGPRWRWMSIGFGPLTWYNNCLTVTAGQRGLALRMQFPIRFFHPPLLIPWERISGVHRYSALLVRGVALTVEPGIDLIFRERQYVRFRAALPERLRL